MTTATAQPEATAPPEEEQLLGLEDFGPLDDTKYEVIDVPEWKGKIRIGSLSAEDAVAWQETTQGDKQIDKFAGLLLLVKSLVDKNGNRLYKSDKDPASIKLFETFKKRNSEVCSRLVTRVRRLNGISWVGLDTAKNV
jgi:hypothetical protein